MVLKFPITISLTDFSGTSLDKALHHYAKSVLIKIEVIRKLNH